MLGLIVELIISWVLLWFFCKESLLALGIIPAKKRVNNFLFGFLMAAICCTAYYLSFTVTTNKWVLNKNFSAQVFAASSWWVFNSVLYEELIFRGALLYILIKKLGIKKACAISAISFGVYHWFTFGTLGNALQMLYIFLITATWGFMFAMAFAKTKSLYLSIGLHFGWNIINTVIFSQGPLGSQLLINRGREKLGIILSLAVFLFQILAVPFITYRYLKEQHADEKQEPGNLEMSKNNQ